MAWDKSSRGDRRQTLPKDWERIRKRILQRDGYTCQNRNVYGDPCREIATDIDHIGNRLDHSDANLQALCEWHHDQKTAQQGADARQARQDRIESRFRRSEPDPLDLIRQGLHGPSMN